MLWVAVIFYGPLLASAAFVEPRSVLALGPGPDALRSQGLGLAVAAGASLLIVLASRWASRSTRWGRALAAELGALAGGMDSAQVLAVSLLSAFGEELLFRGVALAYLGLWLQGTLFGLFHFPVRRALWPWTVFALAMGVGLGVLTQWSASLWPAVLLHFCVNYFNLHDLAAGPAPARPPAPHDPHDPPGPADA
jgi:membrane protease YdiL (CAAX protease family)